MGQIRLINNKSTFKRFPVQVEEVMQKLKKGKSKEKGRSKNIIDWYLSWGETIESTSFAWLGLELDYTDIISGAAMNLTTSTPEERINRSCVTLFGKANKWQAGADTPIWVGPRSIWKGVVDGIQIGICPAEVIDLIQFTHDEELQKQNEIDELLK